MKIAEHFFSTEPSIKEVSKERAKESMQPLDMVAVPSDDSRRLEEFPERLVDCLAGLIARGTTPRDIVGCDVEQAATGWGATAAGEQAVSRSIDLWVIALPCFPCLLLTQRSPDRDVLSQTISGARVSSAPNPLPARCTASSFSTASTFFL